MSFRDHIEKLSPRELRLFGLLAVVFGLLLFVGLPAYAYKNVTAERDRNEAIRAELRQMDQAGELLALRRAQRDAVALRYAKAEKLELGSFISGAARDNGLEVPESKPQPDIKGKAWIEHVHEVKLRRVGLLPFVKMLEKIERSGYPVAITELSIKNRTGDAYDIELSVSAFEKPKAATPKPGAAASGTAKEEEQEP